MYLRDVCLTLAAFLGTAPAAAPTLLGGGRAALAALAPLHDDMLPALSKAAQRQKPPAAQVLARPRSPLRHS